MTQVTFQGDAVNISGLIPSVGTLAPQFSLTAADLSELTLKSFAGKNVILNIFPSVDTPVCATGVRKFNEAAEKLENTVVVCVSADLPFATGRFCDIEGISNVQHASTFRSFDFAEVYGVAIPDGALRGLTTRAVVCINSKGVVTHSELVGEITDEANYDLALNAFE